MCAHEREQFATYCGSFFSLGRFSVGEASPLAHRSWRSLGTEARRPLSSSSYSSGSSPDLVTPSQKIGQNSWASRRYPSLYQCIAGWKKEIILLAPLCHRRDIKGGPSPPQNPTYTKIGVWLCIYSSDEPAATMMPLSRSRARPHGRAPARAASWRYVAPSRQRCRAPGA
jgi:hypothetical protein